MDLIVELTVSLIRSLFFSVVGGMVGVLWPTASASWARWQKIGIGLGIAAVSAFVLTFALAILRGWTTPTWLCFVLGCILAGGYLIVGNVCRSFHEAAKETSNA